MENKSRLIGEDEKYQISKLIKTAIGLRKKSDFAQLIGISVPMMSRFLNGKYSKKIPIDILQKIYENRYNQSDTTLLQQLYLLNGYNLNSIKEIHKMKTIEELFKTALEYHLKRIEDRMQEAVNKGLLYIIYNIPKVLLEDETFRTGLSDALSEAGYNLKKHPSAENFFKISCIEIVEDNVNLTSQDEFRQE